ncbi:MAG: hypothetical protein JWP97_1162 [Labilithrix sp.]|nr:hypothetical protein [Labilithrix sp.]
MTRRRILAAVAGVAGLAGSGVLVACSLVQSLDYLQEGGEAGIAPGGGPPLVTGQDAPALLAQDDSALYWLSGSNVNTVPKAGGAVRTVATFAGVAALAVDPSAGGSVYVATSADVQLAPKTGGAPAKLFDLPAATFAVDTTALFVDATNVWVFQGDGAGADGRILRADHAGAGLVSYVGNSEQEDAGAGGVPVAMTLDDTSVLWFDSNADPSLVHVTAKSSFPAGPITSLSLSTADTPTYSSEILARGGIVYWSGFSNVFSRGRQPADAPIVLYRGGDSPTAFGGIAGDDANLYRLESDRVVRFPVTGGTGVTVAGGLDAPSGVVVDDAGVYVTVQGEAAAGGSILKLAK